VLTLLGIQHSPIPNQKKLKLFFVYCSGFPVLSWFINKSDSICVFWSCATDVLVTGVAFQINPSTWVSWN